MVAHPAWRDRDASEGDDIVAYLDAACGPGREGSVWGNANEGKRDISPDTSVYRALETPRRPGARRRGDVPLTFDDRRRSPSDGSST